MNQIKYPKHKALSVALIFLLITAITQAQNTPTPAPTKTAIQNETASPTVETEIETANPEEVTFTQTDLTVITGNVQRPNGAVWFDDKIYVVCSGDWTIYEIEDRSGSTRTYIYGVRNGHSMVSEVNSNNELTLWVPDFATNQLLLVNSVRAPQIIADNLEGPWGILQKDEDEFLITSLNGNSIYAVNRDGTTRIIAEALRSPTGIASNTDYVYVANSGSARRAIEWFEKSLIDSSNDTPISTQPLVSGLQNVTGMVLAEDGMLYFAYSLGTRGVVGKVDPIVCQEKGGCTNDEVQIVVYTELAAPLAGLTISPDMRLFIHTMFRPEIYWVQLAQ